jgi:hypothetical protein
MDVFETIRVLYDFKCHNYIEGSGLERMFSPIANIIANVGRRIDVDRDIISGHSGFHGLSKPTIAGTDFEDSISGMKKRKKKPNASFPGPTLNRSH